MVIADRGFLNGKQLWELKHKLKIDFIILQKRMTIRDDAIALRKEYEEKTKAEWKYGKVLASGYGVDGLTSYFEYNPQGTKQS